MEAPVLIGGAASEAATHDHALEAAGGGVELLTGAFGLLLHVGAMIAVMAVVAVLVNDKLGRRAWINLDAVWAGAFVLAGLLSLFT